jgi:anti-sigma factor RsiW
MVTCKELIVDLLYDYLDDAPGKDLAAELEAHLAICAPCRAYLATYKKTRELAAGSSRPVMPDEMKVRLREFLLEKLAEGNP